MHRVGIIPFDIQGDAIALLFVTSQTRGRWILPKGRIKSGETHVQAGHREGFEEAGVKGVLLEDFPFTVVIGKQSATGVQKVPVTYYPYLVQEQADEWPEKERRQRHWALIEKASKVAHRDDYLGLIRQFSDLGPWIIEAARLHKSQQQEQQTLAQ
ncbi:MAG: NUDIX domain-containing protein [Alphaproteobacteria bacterium]|nr:NUDIX domain-containing protein [Alphaproteobacteria bacterium]